jgi:transcriptional regulator with XRE-family HTH domain
MKGPSGSEVQARTGWIRSGPAVVKGNVKAIALGRAALPVGAQLCKKQVCAFWVWHDRRVSEHHDQAHDRRQLVAARIREARRSRGMGTLEFARALGVSRREINYLEVGRHQPGLRTLSKIVDLTGKSYEWLFGVEVEEGANVFSTAATLKIATEADSELVHPAAIRTLRLLGFSDAVTTTRDAVSLRHLVRHTTERSPTAGDEAAARNSTQTKTEVDTNEAPDS